MLLNAIFRANTTLKEKEALLTDSVSERGKDFHDPVDRKAQKLKLFDLSIFGISEEILNVQLKGGKKSSHSHVSSSSTEVKDISCLSIRQEDWGQSRISHEKDLFQSSITQADSGKSRIGQVDSGESEIIQAGSSESGIVQTGSSESRITQADSGESKIAQADSGELKIAQAGSGESRITESSSGESRITHNYVDESRISHDDVDESRVTHDQSSEALSDAHDNVWQLRIPQDDGCQSRIAQDDSCESRIPQDDARQSRIAQGDLCQSRIPQDRDCQSRIAQDDSCNSRDGQEEFNQLRFSQEDSDQSRAGHEVLGEQGSHQEDLGQPNFIQEHFNLPRAFQEESSHSQTRQKQSGQIRIHKDARDQSGIRQSLVKARNGGVNISEEVTAFEEQKDSTIALGFFQGNDAKDMANGKVFDSYMKNKKTQKKLFDLSIFGIPDGNLNLKLQSGKESNVSKSIMEVKECFRPRDVDREMVLEGVEEIFNKEHTTEMLGSKSDSIGTVHILEEDVIADSFLAESAVSVLKDSCYGSTSYGDFSPKVIADGDKAIGNWHCQEVSEVEMVKDSSNGREINYSYTSTEIDWTRGQMKIKDYSPYNHCEIGRSHYRHGELQQTPPRSVRSMKTRARDAKIKVTESSRVLTSSMEVEQKEPSGNLTMESPKILKSNGEGKHMESPKILKSNGEGAHMESPTILKSHGEGKDMESLLILKNNAKVGLSESLSNGGIKSTRSPKRLISNDKVKLVESSRSLMSEAKLKFVESPRIHKTKVEVKGAQPLTMLSGNAALKVRDGGRVSQNREDFLHTLTSQVSKIDVRERIDQWLSSCIAEGSKHDEHSCSQPMRSLAPHNDVYCTCIVCAGDMRHAYSHTGEVFCRHTFTEVHSSRAKLNHSDGYKASRRMRATYPPFPGEGSAPFVLCKHCLKILRVPEYLPPKHRGSIQSLQCSACSKVSKFSLLSFS